MVRKSNKKGASSAREEPVCNELTTDGKGSAPDSSDMVVELATAEQEYKGIPSATKKSTKTPTVNDMLVDPITQLASEHWASKAQVTLETLFVVVITTCNTYLSLSV